MKKLYRSRQNRIIAGVFAGLGSYLEIDPTILRLTFALITAFSGFVPGIIAYIAAAIIIPENPEDIPKKKVEPEQSEP
ncbi:MAG: PspC domain-containing protein [Patescibacteria group bacterium]